MYYVGPTGFPTIAGSDLSQHDSHFVCTPYTYNDLLSDEIRFARVLVKALDYIVELDPVG